MKKYIDASENVENLNTLQEENVVSHTQFIHYTIYLIKPRSKRFKEFLDEHYPEGKSTTYRNECLLVEHRYIDGLVEYLVNDCEFIEGDDFSVCV